MTGSKILGGLVAVTAAALWAALAGADAVADFHQGKTVSIYISAAFQATLKDAKFTAEARNW